MPYEIRRKGEQYCVVKKETREEVEGGCHDTKEKAMRHMAALYEATEGESASVVAAVDKEWNGSASRFSDEEYKRSAAGCRGQSDSPKQDCFLPHHEPGGALNRRGLHAAAARFNQVDAPAEAKSRAAAHLRRHYEEVGEDPPEALK